MSAKGIQTTEFWSTLFLHVLTALVTVSAIFGHPFNGSVLQPLIPVAALMASGIAQAYYSRSRATVKIARTIAPVAVTPAPVAVTPVTSNGNG